MIKQPMINKISYNMLFIQSQYVPVFLWVIFI